MKLQEPKTLKEIAEFLNCEFSGDPAHLITGLNEIHRVVEGDAVFVDHPKYYDKAIKSKATTILIDKEVDCPDGKGLLISKHPFDDFNKLTKHFKPVHFMSGPIGEDSQIADSAMIYPNVTIGNNVTIGENVLIYPGVVIMDRTIIEDNVIIGANTVIGHSAFYYKKKETGYDRLHTCGNVHLKKNVEIGALCTIDAGVTDSTIIGEGSKLDNQVQIGHDTVIGKNCLIAANVGIAGCTEVQNNVTIWGQVGCASNVVIGENAVILAQSGISKSLAPNKTYFGSPAKDIRLMYREMAALRKLPEILENM
ncbi:UDP-3-O-(3-hydroxymyristoyl)glucosamine N-acyltransferase [Brumimicrobium glaciale]|jgi:UDP-3-O-[3-hydroxymyristoyl] glucosamine N-acyltransferase|uniref:UDP-3-O-(3-hydroxymyristoyl)glucosamine N-acyltransferase n=1 Tax=Brumimicrobium glaciale TaxID=200475 RepID=A0A4Q4KV47_9FLAO|nr:LpxD N-terminal domain-containing protein [Brumimicrobium glaciale]RYM36004.1 UDP-3-O-(3-hydroxymyristoyl)glucosamine N-acyltransferase [Brumimicrobium glaciale]